MHILGEAVKSSRTNFKRQPARSREVVYSEPSCGKRASRCGYRWFLSRAEALRASDGTLLYWIGINLDTEERKLAEEGLAASPDRLRR